MMQPLRTIVKVSPAVLTTLAAVLMMLVIGVIVSALKGTAATPEVTHAGPTLAAVRSLSSLVTTRVTIADATTAEISGFGGSMSAVLVLRGDALLGINLEQARISDMNPNARSFVLDLPQPAVLQARVDHDRTRVFAIQRHGFWVLMRLDDVTRQLVDTGMREAQQTIQKSATDEAIVATAREHAEHVLQAFAASAGWHINIRWVPAK